MKFYRFHREAWAEFLKRKDELENYAAFLAQRPGGAEIAEIFHCTLCDRMSLPSDATRWRTQVDDEYNPWFYCPDCTAREFRHHSHD